MTTRRSDLSETMAGARRAGEGARRLGPITALGTLAAMTYLGCFLPDFEKVPGEASSTGQGASGNAGNGASGSAGGPQQGGAGGTGSGGTGTGGVPPEGCVPPPTDGEDPCAGKMGTPMVRVPAAEGADYCVDSTEVTNGQYDAFLASMPDPGEQVGHCMWNMDFTPLGWMGAEGIESQPVGGVDWCDAFAFCAAVGKRLCGAVGGGPAVYSQNADEVNEQWYRACTTGNPQRGYPYGPDYDAMRCNGADLGVDAPLDVGEKAQCEGGYCGLLDIAGNVAEWVDICSAMTGDADKCYALGGSYKGPGEQGASCTAFADIARDTQDPALGFRCCAE